MKKILMIAAVMAAIVMVAGTALAATTAGTTTVNANVTGKCGAVTDGTITLTIDPEAAAVSAGSATTVQCTKDFSPISVGAESGNVGPASLSTTGTMTGSLEDGANSITYTLAFTSAFFGNGFGANAPTTLVAGNGASVTAADASNAVYSGVQYTDAVTITVTY
jgi:hypothetical protein